MKTAIANSRRRKYPTKGYISGSLVVLPISSQYKRNGFETKKSIKAVRIAAAMYGKERIRDITGLG